MTEPSRYDRDPEALAWARGKIEAVAKRYEAFADRAAAEGRDEQAAEWRAMATAVRHDLTGGGQGSPIASFDERLPALEEHSGASPAAGTTDRATDEVEARESGRPSPVKVADDLFDAAFGWRPGGTGGA